MPNPGASFELSSRSTGLSFQRTRLSADRTLMSVIRTALSLISFGFTIFQFFQKLAKAGEFGSARAPQRFGSSLVAVGIILLLLGIVYHVRFMRELRAERNGMKELALIHAQTAYPVSLTLITAVVLLFIGAAAILNMLYHAGPL